ncbi:MAG: UvrB/UvrC motif-containing protein, partial [Candidatus Electryoneaceae bacterium]|nr:UvrB/UvrC motif-containing protein [Candidatus Electryoneaceae bacterium]
MQELEQEMFELSDQQRFEGAAVIRDRLRAIQRFSSYQRKIEPDPNDPNHQANRDIIGYVREDHYAAFSVIMIRNGRIIGKNPFYMDRTSGVNDDELIETFVVRHYDRMVRFNLVGSFPD